MEYHKDRFEDASLMAYMKGQIVAALPANIDGNKVYSHQGLTYGGILVDKKQTSTMILLIISEFLKYYSEKSFSTLLLKTPPSIYLLPGHEIVDYAMCLLQAKVYRTDLTYAVEMSFNYKSLSQRRKRSLKKALQYGVEVHKVDQFDTFWEGVLTPNLRERHNTCPVHSREEIALLNKLNPGCIHQFNACFKDQIVAGITIFETNRVAHAQYIASTPLGRSTHALDILVNKLMTEEFAHKDYFNFGIVNEKEGAVINKGLLEWKESFGAKPYVHKFYEIETLAYKKLRNIADSLI
mgnify:CR=1 FL=1